MNYRTENSEYGEIAVPLEPWSKAFEELVSSKHFAGVWVNYAWGCPIAHFSEIRTVDEMFVVRTVQDSYLPDIKILYGGATRLLTMNRPPNGKFKVANLPNLERLRLVGSSNVSYANTERLIELRITNAPGSILSDISGCRKLQILHLAYGPLDSLDSLKNFPNLIDLEIYSLSKLVNLNSSTCLQSLKRVHITSCKQLEDLDWLSDCPQVEELSIFNCRKIRSLEFVRHMKNLKSLRIAVSVPRHYTINSLEQLTAHVPNVELLGTSTMRLLADADLTPPTQ